MGKIITYDDCKLEFENKGLVLLDKEYLFNNTKMKALNKDGYVISTTLLNLRSTESYRIFSIYNPYTIENIKLWLIKNDLPYTLMDDKFIDIKEKLLFKTNENYHFLSSMDGLQSTNGKVRLYHKSNPYTISNIKQYIENNNIKYELLSDEYINNTEKLLLNCSVHGEFKMSWSSLSQGCGCNKCGDIQTKEKLKSPLKEAQNIFIKKGYTPLFNYYNNAHEKHTACSKEGYLIYMCTDSLKNCNNESPSYFHTSNPYTIHNINLYLKLNDIHIELLSEEYNGKNKKLKWKCENNHIFKMCWDNFYQGQRCRKCYLDANKGKNNPNYNHDKTDEERLLGRYTMSGESQITFRINVFTRDNRFCQCCGSHNDKINAHHLDGYNWAKDKRFDVTNGVTLCEKCHKEFHKIYGKGNNTKLQYTEWIETHKEVII